VSVSFDAALAAEIGPFLEGLAARFGLALSLPDIGASLPTSTVRPPDATAWEAIAVAVDESIEATERGHDLHLQPYRYVAVDGAGRAFATSLPPDRLERVRGDRGGFGPVKYDDAKWHIGDAPDPTQAFVHIWIYLGWLTSRGMTTGVLDAGGTGEAAGWSADITETLERTDGRLTSDMLTADGRAFTEYYFSPPDAPYLDDLALAFGRDASTYAIPADSSSLQRMEPLMDRQLKEWSKSRGTVSR
jgi:hypothetical protein